MADLRFNNLDTESATALAAVAKEKQISLCGIKPEQTEANFQGETFKRMGPADAILLTADLAVRTSVTSVSLLGNKFDIKSATMLMQIKEGHPKLKTLCGLTHEETQLDYKCHWLGPADAMLLAPELQVMGSLTYLW